MSRNLKKVQIQCINVFNEYLFLKDVLYDMET